MSTSPEYTKEIKEGKLFAAFIPANLFCDPKISANAKLLWGNIASFCVNKRKCYVSNEVFACALGVEKRTVQRALLELENKGWITREINGEHRALSINIEPLSTENEQDDVQEMSRDDDVGVTGARHDDHHNIKSNIKSKSISINKDPPPLEFTLDFEKQDISTGKYELKGFSELIFTPQEFDLAQKVYKERGVSFAQGIMRAQSQIQASIHKTEGSVVGQVWSKVKTFAHLTGFILRELQKNKEQDARTFSAKKWAENAKTKTEQLKNMSQKSVEPKRMTESRPANFEPVIGDDGITRMRRKAA